MKITIEPYSKDWASAFEFEAGLLRQRLSDGCLIEHIGSTSVPGLAAKPIIDILIGIPYGFGLDQRVEEMLEDDSYLYVPYWESSMFFRRFFVKMKKNWNSNGRFPRRLSDSRILSLPIAPRQCHVHMVEIAHPFFEEHIRFRNILCSNESVLQKYQELKEGLAKQEWESSSDYAGAKTEFIRGILDNMR
ncbi:MAG: GrpB family protein [Bacteroidetes bacterium]|nr:GrpB family protein [Bacteroidota bacterium]